MALDLTAVPSITGSEILFTATKSGSAVRIAPSRIDGGRIYLNGKSAGSGAGATGIAAPYTLAITCKSSDITGDPYIFNVTYAQ